MVIWGGAWSNDLVGIQGRGLVSPGAHSSSASAAHCCLLLINLLSGPGRGAQSKDGSRGLACYHQQAWAYLRQGEGLSACAPHNTPWGSQAPSLQDRTEMLGMVPRSSNASTQKAETGGSL